MFIRKYWHWAVAILLFVVLAIWIECRNSYFFDNYFNEVAVTKCVTIGESFNDISSSVGYLYKANGFVYEGSFKIDSERVQYEKGIYYCVYSKKDAKINAFIPYTDIEKVQIIKKDKVLLKKYLDRSQKARYLRKNNRLN
ncbi:hypothetical protein [Carboxylicivirga caseinilyticus]|uniref:hypothetical protein n=1 Tax=Carboxylicivirga caseinilyticus TaxID=3417572 RepID=UPI003D3548D1|nr:hypothetical protein [Marinilabiliaceae bacterium A049]